jgi:hypothetical protein
LADGVSEERLCTDALVALKYNFIATSYTTGNIADNEVDPYGLQPWIKTESATYDVKSIMHYASVESAKKPRSEITDVKDAVLAEW